MANPPLKFHEGNKLIHDPHGSIHFVNEKKNEHYWTAKPFQVAYKNEKDANLKDYFDFFKESDELLYFDESGQHKRIDCNELQEELDSINEGREDGVMFNFSASDSTFWLDFYEGTLFLHEKEVENQHLDMFRIVRRDYHIWDGDARNNSKKLDLCFSRFIECRGPCICKPGDAPHDVNDYMQHNIQDHEDLRETNFVLRFREYDGLLRFEKTFKPLPKPILIVHYNQPVATHHMTYRALHQGHIPVIAKEIKGLDQAQKNRLGEHLDKFNSDKQFLTFYGIHEFQNRSFLVFQSFSDCAINSTTSESLFGTSPSQEEQLLKNLRGLIEGVSYLHNDVKVHGTVDSSNVVVVKNRGTGQNELKLFVPGFVENRHKTKTHDLIGLADVFECLIDMFDCENEESKHLIQCLRDGRCNISDLKEHPTFWTPETKLEFICACFLAWKNITCFEQSLPSIEQAVAMGKRGNIDRLFFLRMEKYGSYAIGKPSCIGQLTRFIRHAKTHEQELSKEDVGWFYNYNLKGMEQYFRERFPNLLIELYQLVQQTCAGDEIFKRFDIQPGTTVLMAMAT